MIALLPDLYDLMSGEDCLYERPDAGVDASCASRNRVELKLHDQRNLSLV